MVAARSEIVLAVSMKRRLKERLRDMLPAWLWARLKKAPSTARTLVRRLLPQWLRASLKRQRERVRFEVRLVHNYVYDLWRFRRYSANRSSLSRENLRALITMDYHRIEKGLALRDPRLGFGAYLMPRLLSNLQTYRAAYGTDQVFFVTLNALAAYVDFNEARGYQVTVVREGLSRLLSEVEDAANAGGRGGGVHPLSAQEVREFACRDLEGFFRSRHSIRQFADTPVPRELVEKAVSMAVCSPSVCNRQSWRVHVYSDPESKQSVLRFQNGNRGFGDQAACVLIVTTDIESFTSVGERNQPWIDGGMFAMSLIWALHSFGVGTCCLNFCVEKETDAALRARADIPDSQAVIMMIAVGSLPESFAVAQSPRKHLDEVIVFHDVSATGRAS
jgi:nitroreductase